MSDNKPPVNRIPHESILVDSVSSWSLPAMKGAIKTESSSIKNASGMHIRRKEALSKSGVKERIDVVSPEETPKSLTAEELKNIAEDAHKEGYGEGFAQGMRKGTEKGITKGTQQGKEQAYKETKTEMIELQNRLRDISKNLLSPMIEQDEALENTIVEMAFFFAQSLLEAEVEQSPSKLYSIVNKALSVMPVGAQNISVVLNSHDAELLENLLPKTDRSWNIQRDDSLKSGGCMVKSKESFVDYSIESKIKSFMEEVKDSQEMNLSQAHDTKDWREEPLTIKEEPSAIKEEPSAVVEASSAIKEEPLSVDGKEDLPSESDHPIHKDASLDSKVLNKESESKDLDPKLNEHTVDESVLNEKINEKTRNVEKNESPESALKKSKEVFEDSSDKPLDNI